MTAVERTIIRNALAVMLAAAVLAVAVWGILPMAFADCPEPSIGGCGVDTSTPVVVYLPWVTMPTTP